MEDIGQPEAPMFTQRLRQLRLARGLTMEELVEATGGVITKQSISKYELGKAYPTPSVLEAIAGALGVKTSALIKQPQYEIKFIAYRKTAKTSKKTMEEVEARVASALENRMHVRDLIGNFDPPNIPNYKVKSIEDAEVVAKELRIHWSLADQPILDLIGTIESNNIDVIDLPIEDGFDGVSARATNHEGQLRGAALVTRSDVSGARQRFNLAHELGHLVMSDISDTDEELAAHRFAGAFLVPAERLIKEIGPKRDSLYYKELLLLRSQFGASVQALMHRMKDLNIISDGYYKHWNITWNKAGYKRCEPEEEEVKCEKSRTFKQYVYRAFAENLIQAQEAERLLDEPLNRENKISQSETHLMALLRLPKNERDELIKKQVEDVQLFYQPNGSLNIDDLYPGEPVHA